MRTWVKRLFVLAILFFTSLSIGNTPEPFHHPILLVHGFGPRFLVNMRRYRKYLIDDGVSAKNIYLINYPELANPKKIAESVGSSINRILSHYPQGTQIDIISHSYGGFVSLYGALESGNGSKIHKYVALAAVTRGVNNLLHLCSALKCGDTIPHLVPFMNPFITDYIKRHSQEIRRIQKCALYSPDDSIVNDPADSGAFPDGINLSLTGVKHMDFIRNRELYELMKATCY